MKLTLRNIVKHFKQADKVDNQEDLQMNEEDKQTLAAAETKTAELVAQLAIATETLEVTRTALAELAAQHAEMKAAFDASEEAKKTLATTLADKRMAARTAAITEAIGTSQLTTVLAATDTMSDEQFNTIVGAMAKSFEAEAKSAMFQEKGVAASADASKVAQEESKEMKILKAQYQKTK